MQSCDTNILLHAINEGDPLRVAAAGYLNSMASDQNFVICELALAELYVILRNPRLTRRSVDAPSVVAAIRSLRSNPYWKVIDYPGGLMEKVWAKAATPSFPHASIYDARLALTLRHFGVTHFATRNVRHFQDYGFEKVFDPTEGHDL